MGKLDLTVSCMILRSCRGSKHVRCSGGVPFHKHRSACFKGHFSQGPYFAFAHLRLRSTVQHRRRVVSPYGGIALAGYSDGYPACRVLRYRASLHAVSSQMPARFRLLRYSTFQKCHISIVTDNFKNVNYFKQYF